MMILSMNIKENFKETKGRKHVETLHTCTYRLEKLKFVHDFLFQTEAALLLQNYGIHTQKGMYTL